MKIRILMVMMALGAVTPSFANGPIRNLIRGTVYGAARVVGGAGYVAGATAYGAARVVGGVAYGTAYGVGHVFGHPFQQPYYYSCPPGYYCR